MQIVVNGTSYTWDWPTTITYSEVLTLAGLEDAGSVISVTWTHGRNGPSGILLPGDSAVVQDGASFSAYRTGNA